MGEGASIRREQVLLALAVLEGQTITDDLAALLGTVDVSLVGYHVVPEQTPPSQMRQQFESQAEAALDDVAARIEAAGGGVSRRLVFTHELEQSLDRIEAEVGTTAELLPNPTGPVTSMLVPVRGEVDPVRLATFVQRLRGERDIDVRLYAPTNEDDEETATALTHAIRERLIDAGVPSEAVDTDIVVTATPVASTVDQAIEHDVTVMAERITDWRSIIFGELEARVAQESLGPVFVVRGLNGPVNER